MIFKCKHCNKGFEHTPYHNKTREYCSSYCRSTAWKERNTKKHKFICLNCKKTFWKGRPKDTRGRAFKYCSRQCNGASIKGKPKVKGKTFTTSGYVLVHCPEHPKAKDGRYLEHRVVMEKTIKRQLKESEYVHHIDGNKQNNDINNLLIVNGSNHSAATSKHRDRAIQAEEFIKKQGLWQSYLRSINGDYSVL